jgi:hypothetical protein
MHTVEEAKRHLRNAKELLRDKARKEDDFYQDRKCVKLAGHAAYTGILIALDQLLQVKKKGRMEVKWYKEQLSKMDKKVLNNFVAAYDTLHLAMGYDGNSSVKVAQAGLEQAEYIINWVEMKLPPEGIA